MAPVVSASLPVLSKSGEEENLGKAAIRQKNQVHGLPPRGESVIVIGLRRRARISRPFSTGQSPMSTQK